MKRKKTRKVKVGNVYIGGNSPITVQSMTNTDTRDVSATVNQIKRLEDAGCEIVRVAVANLDAAKKLGEIKSRINIPLVADIHFDYLLAIEAIKQGVDKLRINPGNIGSREKVETVVKAAKKAKIPIRIGVNAGSLKNIHSAKTHRDRAKILVDAALEHIKILESFKFYDTLVSLKASDIETTIEAYRLFSTKRNYPLHIGITESGSLLRGTIKSSVGIGILLNSGIGDTVRVSLTADPVEEVKTAYHILQSLGLRSTGVDIVSCPTCSRAEVDIIGIVDELEKRLLSIKSITSKFEKKPINIAVMGCVVNGPGEAKEADIGIAGGKNSGMLFKNGKIVKKIDQNKWVEEIINYIKSK
ncbi:flavodoxin-dependent (E)-4-hydroxy-3-methylbut-2-enyl-diphosphate synthase [Elusimicrobiota bacterium]